MSDEPKPPGDDGDAEIEEVIRAAEAYPLPTGTRKVRDPSPAKLMVLVHKAEAERARMTAARERAERLEHQLAEQVAEYERRLHGNGERTLAIQERERTLLTELQTQVERTQGVADAVQGLRQATTEQLSAQAATAIAALESSTASGREAAEAILATARENANAICTAAEAQAARVREAADERTAARQQELDELRARLDEGTHKLGRRARELEHRKAGQQRLEQELRAEALAQAAEDFDALKRRLDATEAALHRARDERAVAEAQAQELRDRARRIGDQPEDEVLADIARLEERAAEAEAERDRRPVPSVIDELRATRERAQDAERDADELRAQLAEAEAGDAERRRLSAAVIELEQEHEERQQRDVRLQRRIADLRAELELLGDAAGVEPPDQDLIEIDVASRRRESDEVRWRRSDVSLKQLVEEVQSRMAASGRFYAMEDVRLFLAGLAASHLHILEGISGTGKTSLPIAFAQAVGGEHPVVEVQAAWRDRLDLVGSYNAFDRRYYPTDFARALYQAATPGWRDTIVLIVLDEMNLAHPEHYFADVLSAMESQKNLIEALPRAIGSAAALDDRRSIPIGDNVWFIGTANRDETTSTIADKTYDRSNVMELPDRYTSFPVGDQGHDDGAISASHLERLFAEAARRNAAVADEVLQIATADVLRGAATTLRIGFGNRLDRLVRRFAPVVVASGGTKRDALDHVLATKLVRKLESRFDARPEHLDAFEEALSTAAQADLALLPRTARELERQRERLEL